jgi:hypothetical protein
MIANPFGWAIEVWKKAKVGKSATKGTLNVVLCCIEWRK